MAASVLLVVTFVAALALASPPAVPGDSGDKLSSLEAALSSDPGNLRLANEYRMAVISTSQYDRAIKFFGKLVADHPDNANAHLNYGFADVDKLPVAGSITQLMLANNASSEFSKSLALQQTWIGYYTRGKFYLYWPSIFERTKLGVADLETAMKMQKADKKHAYHVYTFIALGDGYWKLGDVGRAIATWKEGLEEFPDNTELKTRLSKQGNDLKNLIENELDYTRRVDTNMHELWDDA
jgi:tetratricopeptide (TPR) repeat protein